MSFFYFSKWEGLDCLTIVFTLEFLLDSQEFSCVVYARKITDLTHYSITPLNEEGEEVLSHPFILVEKNNLLGNTSFEHGDQLAPVKQACAIALEFYLSQRRSMHHMGQRYIA
ncbi:MAG: hypothetical protein INR73_09130 [Williamsia sp.]|nr:hypothetical protein [Williamsia sp.]